MEWEGERRGPRRTELTRFVSPGYHPFERDLPEKSTHRFRWKDGVVEVFKNEEEGSEDGCYANRRCDSEVSSRDDSKDNYEPNNENREEAEIGEESLRYSWKHFCKVLRELMAIMTNPNTRTFTFRRLKLLEQKFKLHLMLNEKKERLSQVFIPHRDFYNVRKVDTHVHHSGMMNQKHLLRFIQKKVKSSGHERVLQNRDDPNGPPLTLEQVFQSIHLTPYDLNVDTLDVHADNSTFHRFDRFNLKYNPCGQSRLREIFLKTDNFLEGSYLADITHEVFADLHDSKYQQAEYRISIYGRSFDEWDKLGNWFEKYQIFSDNVRWLIQVPRLYAQYKKLNIVQSFQEMLYNIFEPIFEATIDPESHPQVYRLLQQVVGFDSVDDESRPPSVVRLENCVPPQEWTDQDDPPYSYYSFYIYCNIYVLNKLREEKGLNLIKYRPHAGEAGLVDNLAVTYLLADGINHGIMLRKSPVLQYLYYLTQIGVAMSPLSNNHLFIEYPKNPFYDFYQRGLNVSLSTDDPLMFHYVTREPLMEEYSVAAQVWKLSNVDLCELARNSVLQSGFEFCVKEHWLGKGFYLKGERGNNVERTNLPNTRLRFRFETLVEELNIVFAKRLPKNIRVLPTYYKRMQGGIERVDRNETMNGSLVDSCCNGAPSQKLSISNTVESASMTR